MTEIKKDKLLNVTQLCNKLSYICSQLNNCIKECSGQAQTLNENPNGDPCWGSPSGLRPLRSKSLLASTQP
mgnify:FL=1